MTSALIGSGLLAGLAAFLLILGLRGRRVGDEPFCAHCDYNLTGVASGKCPECGTAFDWATAPRGRRKRRPVYILGAFLFLASGVAGIWRPMYLLISETDWYEYLPEIVVQRMADGGDAPAFKELTKRVANGGLKDSQVHRIAAACLAKQLEMSQSQTSTNAGWLELLDQLDVQARLSAEERNRYYEQAVTDVRLEVRKRLRSQARLPIRLSLWLTTSALSPLRCEIDNQRVELTGSMPDQVRSYNHFTFWPVFRMEMPTRCGRWKMFQSREADFPAGRYHMNYFARLVLRRGEVLWSRDVHFAEDLVVDYDDAPDPVILPSQKGDPDQLQKALHVTSLDSYKEVVGTFALGSQVVRNAEHIPLTLSVIGALPFPIAFDVIMRTRQGERTIGTLCGTKGATQIEQLFMREECDRLISKSTVTDKVVFILRPSTEVARDTLDLHEIWGGEIMLGPILMQVPSSGPAFPN